MIFFASHTYSEDSSFEASGLIKSVVQPSRRKYTVATLVTVRGRVFRELERNEVLVCAEGNARS